MTTDLKAAHHVLFNNYDYPKPKVIKYIIGRLFGSGAFCCIIWGPFDDVTTILGLLTVEGDEHKHQVRFLVSGFVRELLSNKTSSARFWSVVLVYWGVKRLTVR